MSSGLPTTLNPSAPADDLGGVLREYVAVADRLQRTHEALQEEVRRLRRELAVKDRELMLRRRLAALGELVAGVAHEVRNPLGAIQLYSDLLRTRCRDEKLVDALRLIDKIEAGIQAIDAVVEDTLALAPRGRDAGGCDVAGLVAGVHESVRRVLGERRVALQVSCPPEPLRVLADERGLQRVLINLLTNAAEASSPGQTVHLSVAAEARRVHFSVRDSGPGLAPEVRERIFEPFFTTKSHGTGLGLTIAHRLVEAYGGRLDVRDADGGGAEFTVSLERGATSASLDEAAADEGRTNAA